MRLKRAMKKALITLKTGATIIGGIFIFVGVFSGLFTLAWFRIDSLVLRCICMGLLLVFMLYSLFVVLELLD